MTAHKNAEMIKAKANSMELVIFTLSSMTNKWEVTSFEDLVKNEDFYFFLCLPKHNENGQCLHWLNGGDVQLQAFPTNPFIDYIVPLSSWSHELWWMSEQCNIRIKPRKEKRWIAVKRNDKSEVYTVAFESLAEAISTLSWKYWQFIEIEVEV